MNEQEIRQQLAEEQAGLDAAVIALLEDLREMGLFATGAELVRSPGRSIRLEPVVDTVPQSTSSVTLFATNARRKGATIYNDSTAVLYVKLGKNASSSDYTIPIAEAGYYELPAGYRGTVTAVFSAGGSGQARTTEYGW